VVVVFVVVGDAVHRLGQGEGPGRIQFGATGALFLGNPVFTGTSLRQTRPIKNGSLAGGGDFKFDAPLHFIRFGILGHRDAGGICDSLDCIILYFLVFSKSYEARDRPWVALVRGVGVGVGVGVYSCRNQGHWQ
jgi:hypothetical protein